MENGMKDGWRLRKGRNRSEKKCQETNAGVVI